MRRTKLSYKLILLDLINDKIGFGFQLSALNFELLLSQACGNDEPLCINKVGIAGDQGQRAVFGLAHDFDLGRLDDLIPCNSIGKCILVCQEHDFIPGDQPVQIAENLAEDVVVPGKDDISGFSGNRA